MNYRGFRQTIPLLRGRSNRDANTVEVIRGPTDGSGPDYYAVFDAFWDYKVGHLSDNFCPPKVTHDNRDAL